MTKCLLKFSTMGAMLLLSLFPRTGAQAQSALDGFDPHANGPIRVVVVQPDGKILLGGQFTTLSPNGGAPVPRAYMARLNSDGTLDTAFDPNPTGHVYAIAVQSDGKILAGGAFGGPNGIGGQARNNIARLDPATGLADSFNPNADSTVVAIAVQADGKILAGGLFNSIGGQTRHNIARLDPLTGSTDTFDPNASGAVFSIAVQADGKILAGGFFNGPNSIGGQTRNRIARLDATTGLADSFDPNANSSVWAIALQADGKILAGGSFSGANSIGGQARNSIARLDATTGLADSFNPNADSVVFSITVQTDGKILAGGGFANVGGQPRNRIARLDATTGLADSFDPNANGVVYAIAVQADGKIVAGGEFTSMRGQTRNYIARLEKDGRLDQTLNLNVSAQGNILATAVQPDGKILIGGRFTSVFGVPRNNIARLNTDGTLDMIFDPNADGWVFSIAIQADGKILAGGLFTNIGGQSRNNLARLDAATGSADSFNANSGGSPFNILSIAVQADGKILVGGSFLSIGGQTRNRIARLNPATALADSFDPNANGVVYSIAVQPDGKILAGGQFNGPNSIGGQSRNYIARLDATTGLADSFDPVSNNWVFAITLQADGKILVGGNFLSIGGQTRNFIARLDGTTGLADSFNPTANNSVVSIAVQADGKILAGGSFSGGNSIGGQLRNYIARLDATTGLADSFNPNASGTVNAIMVQADGKILAGGGFASMGGQSRSFFARLSNDTAALQNVAVTQTAITWTRDGSSPLFAHVTFEYSNDQVNYTPLGDGTPTGSNWTLTGLNLPTGQNIYVRVRGYYRGGYFSGSESIAESVRNAFLDGSTPTPTIAPTPTVTATPTPLATATPAPTSAPTPTPSPSISPTPPPLATATPTSTPTPGCDDTWTATSMISWPAYRTYHAAVWTGSEIIVWGGTDGSHYWNTGLRYDPSTDSWTTISTTNAPPGREYHAAVWTGSEMIVWGGNSWDDPPTGGRYNPSTDSWTAMSTTNAPSGRSFYTAVWTGSEMIVWGGTHWSDVYGLNTGARYNPTTDTWAATSTTNAPIGRGHHTAVWTGSEMIAWGGSQAGSNFNTGGIYNPETDSWTATNTTNTPTSRTHHSGVWTGTEMIVWGGSAADNSFNTGGRYNPGTDSWIATNITNAPSVRRHHTAIWTGNEMIIWGGSFYNGSNELSLNTGGRYNPTANSWTATNTINAPTQRANHTVIWTGSEMIVWGGASSVSANSALDTGGRYCVKPPPTPTATPTPATPTPNPSPTSAVTATASPTATATPTATAMVTATASATVAPTPTPSATPTATLTPTPTPTASATATATASATVVPTPTPSATPTASLTPTATVTATPTATATATPTATSTVTPTATVVPTPTPSPTPVDTATPTPGATSTPVPTSTPTSAAQTINLSTRMRVQTGDNVGIGGFIITGSVPKHVVLRAIGPSLAQAGVPDALADPVLELHGPAGFVTIINDNWRDNQELTLAAAGLAPTDNLEAAIDATLAPGSYTAIVRGKGNSSGVALVEVYDIDQSVFAKLANMSTRAMVGTGDDIVIAGFILGGSGDDRIVLRGIGPSLSAIGVANALADPKLELRDSDGALLASNNNWQDDSGQAAELSAANLSPANNLESGLAVTLPPGLYTALLSGMNNSAGIGLVEVYDRGTQ